MNFEGFFKRPLGRQAFEFPSWKSSDEKTVLCFGSRESAIVVMQFLKTAIPYFISSTFSLYLKNGFQTDLSSIAKIQRINQARTQPWQSILKSAEEHFHLQYFVGNTLVH